MSDEKRKELETAIVLGGKDVSVTHWNGDIETVHVRAVRNYAEIREMIVEINAGKELGEGGEEIALTAWATRRPKDWVETLTLDSQIEINSICMELNLPTTRRYIDYQAMVGKGMSASQGQASDGNAQDSGSSRVAQLRKLREAQAKTKSR